jgi:hypothetical protein
MDRLTSSLNNTTKRPYHPAILAAMKLASKKMDRYYSLTDSSSTYRIAMVLHPGMKLEYFRKQRWLKTWIETAQELVEEEYVLRYQKLQEPTSPDDKEKPSNDFTSFGNLSITPLDGEMTELELYLSQPVENVADPLKWWLTHSHTFPTLSQMALDYLSIPATSTAVERVFSQGRHLLSHTRNRMKGKTLCAHLCLGSWARKGLVDVKDLIEVIQATSKKRKRADVQSVASGETTAVE